MEKKLKPATLCIRGEWKPQNGEPVQPPIYQSTTFKYNNTEGMAQFFDLEKSGYFYTHSASPTNDAVAQKIAALEGGVGAMLASSGQAANFYAVFNIYEAGSRTVVSTKIYGGTFSLFGVTVKRLGIGCTFVNQDTSEEEIQKAFRPNARAMFGETISNPGCHVLGIEKFARIAHRNGVPPVADNTFAIPVNCRPFERGADTVTHSTIKYMDGYAAAVGGVVADSNNLDWMVHTNKFAGLCLPGDSYHGLAYVKDFGKMDYLIKLVAQLMCDLGSIPSPQNTFLLNSGLKTLHLRMARHYQNAQRIAGFLEADERVAWVHYCGLKSDQHYTLGRKYLPGELCDMIVFGLRGSRGMAVKFMDSLCLINIATRVAGSRTYMLHPTNRTRRQLNGEQLRTAGIGPTLIRLSMDIENVDSLLDDIKQSLG